jgi:polyisoprenoid-binding protein YceI
MKRHLRPTFILLLLAAGIASPAVPSRAGSTAPQGAAGVWRIDPARSEVRFTITKLGYEDVIGVFRESEGEVRYDPAHPAVSSIRWRVKVASVLTDASNRDRTLQSEEYFDAARHPFLSFVSREVRGSADGTLQVSGDITIRGVTRPLTLSVRPHVSEAGPTFETDFTLDRYEFGVMGGTVLGRLIGREARLHLFAATAR